MAKRIKSTYNIVLRKFSHLHIHIHERKGIRCCNVIKWIISKKIEKKVAKLSTKEEKGKILEHSALS